MTKKCFICGKGQLKAKKYSHSHRKHTVHKKPNLQLVKIKGKRHWVCTACIKKGKVIKLHLI